MDKRCATEKLYCTSKQAVNLECYVHQKFKWNQKMRKGVVKKHEKLVNKGNCRYQFGYIGKKYLFESQEITVHSQKAAKIW
jgi:hypothetical protein